MIQILGSVTEKLCINEIRKIGKDVMIKYLRNWDEVEEGNPKEMEDRGNNKIKCYLFNNCFPQSLLRKQRQAPKCILVYLKFSAQIVLSSIFGSSYMNTVVCNHILSSKCLASCFWDYSLMVIYEKDLLHTFGQLLIPFRL